MNRTRNTETASLNIITDQMKKALKREDAEGIKDCYRQLQSVDMELVSTTSNVFKKYEETLSECNDYLYETQYK